MNGISYGRTDDALMARSRDTTKGSLSSVEKPMGLERLIWSGRGAPRSLVRKEFILRHVSPGDETVFKDEINAVNEQYSVVEGYPQLG
jgi:hypothetical protein